MGGGAWSFLVGGVICLVNSDNERDLNLLNSLMNLSKLGEEGNFKRNQVLKKFEFGFSLLPLDP